MKEPKLRSKFKRFKVEHFAMIFLAIGILILYILSLASNPVFVKDYSKLSKYEGKVVITKGIVIDFDETSRGETVLTLLEPGDLNSTLKVFIESCTKKFEIGDVIQVKGSVLRISESFLELVVVNEKDIEIVGHWHHYRLSLPELAHRLQHSPGEFKYLSVELSGYLKYEPRLPITSIQVTEHPTDGFYSVKVEFPNGVQPALELHKGDLVSLNVTVNYNENNFEYKLTVVNITLLERYGEWTVTLPELMAAPFVFERAQISTSGFIYRYDEHYNYIVLLDSPVQNRSSANSSIWVDISEINLTGTDLQDEYFITIKGSLYYDPQYLDYAIKAKELAVE